MSTIYIACNNCLERGYFLGDVLSVCKIAWLFVQNEPHDEVILSLHKTEPLNWVWEKFIRDNEVKVVWDEWHKGDQLQQYRAFDRRRAKRRVNGTPFDTYRELYPRLDGAGRQAILCGSEQGLGRRNIFEYYYYGQEHPTPNPIGTTRFGPDVIDQPDVQRRADRSMFIAPHEKCQNNAIFTHTFWKQVVEGLLDFDIDVTLNDRGGFLPDLKCDRLHWSFEPLDRIAPEIARQRLVVCGNTGPGWVAAATGVPLIACERDMIFSEYGFRKCGFESLVELIDQPDPRRAVNTILERLT